MTAFEDTRRAHRTSHLHFRQDRSGPGLPAARPQPAPVRSRRPRAVRLGTVARFAAGQAGEPASANFFQLSSGAYCVSRTTPAGASTAGGAKTVYTQFLVVPPDVLARFANNPFAILPRRHRHGRPVRARYVPKCSRRASGRPSAVVDLGLMAQLALDPGRQPWPRWSRRRWPAIGWPLCHATPASIDCRIIQSSAGRVPPGVFFHHGAEFVAEPSRPPVPCPPTSRLACRGRQGITLLLTRRRDAAATPTGKAGPAALPRCWNRQALAAGHRVRPAPPAPPLVRLDTTLAEQIVAELGTPAPRARPARTFHGRQLRLLRKQRRRPGRSPIRPPRASDLAGPAPAKMRWLSWPGSRPTCWKCWRGLTTWSLPRFPATTARWPNWKCCGHGRRRSWTPTGRAIPRAILRCACRSGANASESEGKLRTGPGGHRRVVRAVRGMIPGRD